MFSKNLKFYRLSKQMSKKELADKANVTSMAITNYEKGDRKPSMEIIQALAAALEVRVSDFLQVRNENITFKHCEFRKDSSLSNTQQEYIRESAEEYFSRFMTVVELLGGEVLPDAPACHVIQLSQDPEKNAAVLRAHLGFAADGPIENLIDKLENKGILVYECDIDNDKFSGMNGFVNGRPFIIINTKMNAERNRSTIVHELAHLMFKWPANMGENEIESCRQHQGDDAAVGRMVVVERLHYAVQRLEVAEVTEGLRGGDEDDDAQPDGVGPEELPYAALVFEKLCCRKKERHHKPYPGQQVFERYPW